VERSELAPVLDPDVVETSVTVRNAGRTLYPHDLAIEASQVERLRKASVALANEVP
jgi:hypothetical protein